MAKTDARRRDVERALNTLGMLAPGSSELPKEEGDKHGKPHPHLGYALIKDQRLLQDQYEDLVKDLKTRERAYYKKDAGGIVYMLDANSQPNRDRPVIEDVEALELMRDEFWAGTVEVEFHEIPLRWLIECRWPAALIGRLGFLVKDPRPGDAAEAPIHGQA